MKVHNVGSRSSGNKVKEHCNETSTHLMLQRSMPQESFSQCIPSEEDKSVVVLPVWGMT